MACTSCDNLRKDLEEQKAQTLRYESKIRDMVGAYKMLESQKQSLEIALSVLSVDVPERIAKDGQLTMGNSTGTEQQQVLGAASKTSESEAAEKNDKQPIQMEALKEAITTLTLVNKRKEMEFKRDRRTLVEARDELQRRCEQLEQQLKEQKQHSKSQNLKRLREQLAETQNAQERAMTEHGLMLAELQQQYGKEKRRSDNLEKQVTEMSQRLATKDELIRRAEMQLKEMTKMEQEMQALRKKAEMTPTMWLMRDELANVKASSEQEVIVLRTRFAMQSAQLREREARIEQMEQRVHELSERCAQAEQQCIELEGTVAKLGDDLHMEQAKCKQLTQERLELLGKMNEEKVEDGKSDQSNKLEEDDTDNLMEKFRAIHQQLRAQQPDFDVIATLCLDIPTITTSSMQRSLSRCSDATGPSLSVGITPASTPVPTSALGGGGIMAGGPSRNASSASLLLAATSANIDAINFAAATSAVSTGLCDSCMASRRELDFFKTLIGHLQKKLSALEENHEKTKKEHENNADMLRERILELESSQHRQYAQLAAEAKQRVAELEDELQKQRSRVVEIISEKDREIELTKSALAAFYARNYGTQPENQLPMDPPQQGTTGKDSTGMIPPPLPEMDDTPPAPLSNKRESYGKKSAIICRRKDSAGSVASVVFDRRRSSIEEQSSVVGGGTMSGYISHAYGNHQPVDFSASFSSTTAGRRPASRSNTYAAGSGQHFIGAELGGFAGGAAARNIFYEQELCKREREIGELRNVIRLTELKVRDIEQAMLLKDVQYLQIIETLKEEVRVLEGRLALTSSQTNLAYLRNIFLQFLNQGSVTGRKHILKAIGAVLQLTAVEMQGVDRWSH